MATSRGRHGALRGLLGVMAAVVTLGGLLALIGTSWILDLGAMRGLLSGSAAGLFLRFVGVLALSLAYLLYQAARDPERYVAVIDAFVFVLIAGAMIDVYAALTHMVAGAFLPGLVWGRAAFRLIVAVSLIAWRPRGA